MLSHHLYLVVGFDQKHPHFQIIPHSIILVGVFMQMKLLAGLVGVTNQACGRSS